MSIEFNFYTYTQQKQNICRTFVQCWTNVEDVGPMLYKCSPNVLCSPGIEVIFTHFNLCLAVARHNFK